MANIDHAPSRTMLNLLHVLPAFADEAELRLNAIVELVGTRIPTPRRTRVNATASSPASRVAPGVIVSGGRSCRV